MLCWLRDLVDHLAERWTSSDQRQQMPAARTCWDGVEVRSADDVQRRVWKCSSLSPSRVVCHVVASLVLFGMSVKYEVPIAIRCEVIEGPNISKWVTWPKPRRFMGNFWDTTKCGAHRHWSVLITWLIRILSLSPAVYIQQFATLTLNGPHAKPCISITLYCDHWCADRP